MKSKYQLRKCPRCQDQAFESLKTYAFCINCNYSSDELTSEAAESLVVVQNAIAVGLAKKRVRAAQSRRAALLISVLGCLTLFSACTTTAPSHAPESFSRWYQMRNVEGRRQ